MRAEVTPSRAGSLPLVGEILALDFCNTSSGRGTEGHLEHLKTSANLVTWAHHARIIEAAQQTALLGRWEADQTRAQRFLRRALALRNGIYALTAKLAANANPDPAIVEAIGREHAACLAKGQLTMRNSGFGWTWHIDEAPEEVILGPIAASAMALITTADRRRIKQCAGHHCGWLFLDTTKSNNRRWCEMEVCGNRAKQKRRRGALSPAASPPQDPAP